jgi:periplasmic divalent cation tolerance protein
VSEPLVVMTTVTRTEDAEYIAREMVERRLAACVNILPPVTSVYRWQGEVTREPEHLLLMNRRSELVDHRAEHYNTIADGPEQRVYR